MPSPIRKLQVSATVRVFAGMLAFIAGVLMIENAPGLSIIAVVALILPGILLTSGGAGAYLRIAQLQEGLRAAERFERRRSHTLQGLETKIFSLLLSVAEVDGRADPKQREMVRRFLLERFDDPRILAAVRRWEGARLPNDRIEASCRALRDALAQPDREILFVWACLVALVDERFSSPEHELLQAISRGLSLPPPQARRLFHRAKQQVLGQRTRRAPARADQRDKALAVLGLDSGASVEDIRRRHRELAKRFHPDAHNNRGPSAVAEATQRFREVQQAYEILRSGS